MTRLGSEPALRTHPRLSLNLLDPLRLNSLIPFPTHPDPQLPESSGSNPLLASFSVSEVAELELKMTLLPLLFLPLPIWEFSGSKEEEESLGILRMGIFDWGFIMIV